MNEPRHRRDPLALGGFAPAQRLADPAAAGGADARHDGGGAGAEGAGVFVCCCGCM